MQFEVPAIQLETLMARFRPEVAHQILAIRSALRDRLPTAVELIYEYPEILAFGFCSSERASDCILSLAIDAGGIALSFYQGVGLPDPHQLLLGGGKHNRFMRIAGASTLNIPEVRELIEEAIRRARTPLPAGGGGYTIVKASTTRSAKSRGRAAKVGVSLES